MYRRKHRETAECPRCPDNENNVHVFICTGQGTSEAFNIGMEVVDEYLLDCPSDLATAIRKSLMAFREQREPDFELVLDEDIQYAMTQQWEMGGEKLTWGVLHTAWQPLMAEYLRSTRRSTARWFALLSNTIWELTEQLWDHRNTLEYQKDNSHINLQRNIEANLRIDEIYAMLPPRLYLPISDRHLFNQTIEHRKNRKLRMKRKWIRNANRVLAAYNNIGLQPEARLLRAFFSAPNH